MKHTTISLLLFLFNLCSFAQTSSTITSAAYLKQIMFAYKKVQFYDLKYAESATDKNLDKLLKSNKVLASLVESDNFLKIRSSDLKKMSRLTDLKVVYCKDGILKSISWSILNITPEPEYTSVLFWSGRYYKVISQNGTGNGDFGNNLGIDSIIKRTVGGKSYHLLLGSNKCGNLCIQKSIQLYLINGESIKECTNAFFNGEEYFDRITFQYFLSDQMKAEPSFQISDNEILSPIFGSDTLIETGVKKYDIKFPLLSR